MFPLYLSAFSSWLLAFSFLAFAFVIALAFALLFVLPLFLF